MKRIALIVLLLTAALPTQASEVPLYKGGRLSFVADSTWSHGDRKTLKKHLASIYPELVKVYGEPAGSGTIRIRKKMPTGVTALKLSVKNEVCDAVRDPTLLVFPEQVNDPRTLVRTLCNVFHGNDMVICAQIKNSGKSVIIHDAVEMGMAQAASRIVADRLGYTGDWSEPFEVTASFDQPPLQYANHMALFEPLAGIRLGTASWPFFEWEKNHPGFLKRLNQRLYKTVGSPSYETVWSLAEQITPGARSWFASKRIYQPTNVPGDFLYCFGDTQKIGVGLYRRGTNGKEVPIPNEAVEYELRVGNLTDKQKPLTRPSGSYVVQFRKPTSRYRVTVRWNGGLTTFEHH